DAAVCCHTRMVLGNPRAVTERGLALVAGLSVDAGKVNHDSACCFALACPYSRFLSTWIITLHRQEGSAKSYAARIISAVSAWAARTRLVSASSILSGR